MGDENLILKKKLVVQSFLPLFSIIFVKYFDYRIFQSAFHFCKRLIKKDFGVFWGLWHHPYLWQFIILIISIFWIISGLIAIWQFKNMQMSGFTDAGEKIKIERELTDSGITFFMSFILPLLVDDISTLNKFLVFAAILFMVIMLMIKTNLYYQNPILTLLGYRIYSIKFINPSREQCRGNEYIAVCKYTLDESKIIKWKYISDNVCIMYNKN